MRISFSLDISLFEHFKHKGKYKVYVRMPKLLLKNVYFFL